MEAIRHIIIPETNHLEITLPDNLVHEKIEVIILSLEEPRKSNDDYNSLMGSISENEAKKMLQHVASSRNEWQ